MKEIKKITRKHRAYMYLRYDVYIFSAVKRFMYNDWMIFRDDTLMKTFFRSVLPQDEINGITKRYEFCAQTKVVLEISHWLLIVEIVPG